MKLLKYSIAIAMLSVSFLKAQNYTGNVGIGTDDPKTNLDIRGDLKLTPYIIDSNDNIAQLYRIKNANEGEHKMVTLQDNNSLSRKNIYVFTLSVKLPAKKVQIEDFNTNVNSDEYTLFIVNSNYDTQKKNEAGDRVPSGISHIFNGGSTHVKGENPVKQVDLWLADDKKWHISANYMGSEGMTGDQTNLSQWDFTIMAIKNSDVVRVDPNPNYNPNNPTDSNQSFGTNNAWDNVTYHRHYSYYQPGNPQNPKYGQPYSQRGDSFKLNDDMTGGVNVNPLKQYEQN